MVSMIFIFYVHIQELQQQQQQDIKTSSSAAPYYKWEQKFDETTTAVTAKQFLEPLQIQVKIFILHRIIIVIIIKLYI